MAQNYKYIAADFERYHSGKMSEAEMHALEKAALEDPFLADGLDGYAYTDSPAKDIADIKERLTARRKKKKIFPVIQLQNTWLRIAAMIILIAGIGYLAFQFNFNKEERELATKQEDVKNIAKQIEALKKDSSIPEKNVAINTPSEKGNGLMSKENKLTAPGLDNRNDEVAETPAESMPDKNQQKPVAPEGRRDLASSPEIKLSDKKAEADVLKSDSENMKEVVVTALGIRRSEKSIGYATQKKKPVAENDADSSSQLAAVWQEFTSYVHKNIKIPRNDAGKNYEGKIVISFEINKRGKPKEIKVEQSLCKPCDEEAIRLLKQGPRWKFINDKRQVVTIEF